MPNTVQLVFSTGRESSDHTSSCAKLPTQSLTPPTASIIRTRQRDRRSLAPGMVISCEVPPGKSLARRHGRVHGSSCDRGYGQPHLGRAVCRCAGATHQESAVHESEGSRISPTRLPGPPGLILGLAGSAAKNRDAEVPGPAELSSPPEMPPRSTAAGAPGCHTAAPRDRARTPGVPVGRAHHGPFRKEILPNGPWLVHHA